MPRISLAGFKDPVRRPRFIIWTGTTVLVLAAVVVVALGVTSSRWFCADGCHKVQDDTIIAYSHSSHDKISCISCHIPVNADPVTFLIHKVEAGLGVIPTVRNTYELPLNAEDEVALSKIKMPEAICTQCHDLAHRKITPSAGIIINHDVHSKAGYQCTVCHNRVAHPEDFKLTLPGNAKHANFMKMDACFRCHGLQPGAKAPGQCNACHPKDFKLKPEFHLQADFYPKGHAELAKEDIAKVEEAKAEEKKAAGETKAEGEKAEIPAMRTVSNCQTCHVKATFCDKCHGMEMPHPASFKEPTDSKDPNGHPAMSKAKATAPKCEFCHHQSKTSFCDNCHHGKKVNWKFDAATPWQRQHASAVTQNGVDGCLGKCHQSQFCRDCHTRLNPLPTSHKDKNWLHGATLVVSKDGKPKTAQPSAQHVAAFQKAGGPSACAVCHGDGGTKAAFCAGCHKLDMPHASDYGSQPGVHATAGKKNPAVCSNCHQFRELCSNCHHVGASDANPWLGQHGKSVNTAGNAGSCLAKCHKKADCVQCHTTRKVVPASHGAATWLHRPSLAAKAGHSELYKKSSEPCTYCHGDGGAKAAFCMNCHKLEMPHPSGFGPAEGAKPSKENGGEHMNGFNAKPPTWARGQFGAVNAPCANCHTSFFCDSCHHKDGFNGKLPWGVPKVGTPQAHPAQVRAKGSADCFTCHKETYCSFCHVRASR
ncbi:MAG TPA: cytochrome c3 family protein [Coriobacteriia bacterium]|jgi:hypothetical protein